MLGLNLSLMMQRAGGGPVTITITEADAADGAIIVATSNFSNGSLLIDIDAPAAYAGEYAVLLADLDAGPVNLVAPSFTGTTGTGDVITITPGLWVSWDGLAITQQQLVGQLPATLRQTGFADYTMTAADQTAGLDLRETATDARGSREAQSEVTPFVFQPVTLALASGPPAPRADANKSVNKLTLAFRASFDTWGIYTSFIRNFGFVDVLQHNSNSVRFVLDGVGNVTFPTLLQADFAARKHSIMISVDTLNSGDLGAGILAKMRVMSSAIDETVTIAAPGGYTPANKTLNATWTEQVSNLEFDHWVYLDTATAFDPAVDFGLFFDTANDGQVKSIGIPTPLGVGFPGGTAPDFFLQAPASNFSAGANAGSDATFSWQSGAVTEV